jgi:hypothetical protein
MLRKAASIHKNLCYLLEYQCHLGRIVLHDFFLFGATAPIWALAYLHEILRFTTVY